MTDTTPEAIRALAYRLTDVTSLTALTAAATLRALAAEKEAARDARREALEEAAKVATSFAPANALDRAMVEAIEDHGRVIEAAIRALIDSEPAPVVPDGWKLVPVEPTREMEEAHFDAHAKSETIFADVADVWRAMLAAAPTEPTP